MDSRTSQELSEQLKENKKEKLSKDEVIAIFNKEYDEEFAAFEDNIRTVARGNTGLSNTWTDYLGPGVISLGALLANLPFGVLAGLKIISAFVTLGVGAATSVGVIVGVIAFRKYRITNKRAKYNDAEDFLESELYEDSRDEFKSLLRRNLMPALVKSDHGEINLIVKYTIAAIANLILEKEITQIDDLTDANFCELLEESLDNTGGFKLSHDLMRRVIADIKASKESQLGFNIDTVAKQIKDAPVDLAFKQKSTSSAELSGVHSIFSSTAKLTSEDTANQELEEKDVPRMI